MVEPHPAVRTVVDASMVARIDGGGVIRTHRVETGGNVTVGRPGWLSEATASVGSGGGRR